MTTFSPKQFFSQTGSYEKTFGGGGKCWYWQQHKQKLHCLLFLHVNIEGKSKAMMSTLKKKTVQCINFPLSKKKKNVSILVPQTTIFPPSTIAHLFILQLVGCP